MGRVLANIHSVRQAVALPTARSWVGWTLKSEYSRSGWIDHPRSGVIEEALTGALERELRRPSVLSHGDFNAGNVLFSGSRLTGVIDWETAERAPRGSDVGACRFDCAVTGGPEGADAFVEGYGRDVRGLWFWELLTGLKFIALYKEWIPLWHRFGLTDLEEPTVRKRIDAAIEDALKRAS